MLMFGFQIHFSFISSYIAILTHPIDTVHIRETQFQTSVCPVHLAQLTMKVTDFILV